MCTCTMLLLFLIHFYVRNLYNLNIFKVFSLLFSPVTIYILKNAHFVDLYKRKLLEKSSFLRLNKNIVRDA